MGFNANNVKSNSPPEDTAIIDRGAADQCLLEGEPANTITEAEIQLELKVQTG